MRSDQHLIHRLFKTALLVITLFSSSNLTGQTDEAELRLLETIDAPQLGYTEATILGLVEGITEYLPISSTGHLILTNEVLDLNQEVPALNRSGEVLVNKDGSPYTFKQAIDSYIIIIQAGAILAVCILYRVRILSILMGVLGRDPLGLRLLINLMAAFIPAAALGLLFDDAIEAILFGAKPVMFALAGGGILMILVERWRNSTPLLAQQELHTLTTTQCLIIGLLQSVALIPGTSRSMMTIVGGYVVGLSPKLAAEFSFLLGFITLSAASAYKLLKSGELMFEALPAGPIIWGTFVATVAAVFAIRWLVTYLTKHGLTLFAWYRFALALALWFYLN
jgi:undecaprenyl-diphosphatase